MKEKFRIDEHTEKLNTERIMYCKDWDEALAFVEYLNQNGLTWCTGDPYSERSLKYKFIDGILFFFDNGTYMPGIDLDQYKMDSEYTVYRFSDFDFSDDDWECGKPIDDFILSIS